MLEKLRSIEERLWHRVEKTPTCWLWLDRPNADGYGAIRITHEGRCRSMQIHRVFYTLEFGLFPDDQVIRHRCDTPACIRPDHLIAGNHADNVRDRVERGRCARGERNGRAKLSAEDVLAIRARLLRGESCSSVAREFGLDRKTISALRARKTWRHLPPETDSDPDVP